MLNSMRRVNRLIIIVALGIASDAVPSALAEVRWQVVFLHPEGASSSETVASAGSRQGGIVVPSNGSHPTIWSRRANSWVDLLSDPWLIGEVGGMDGNAQAGEVSDLYTPHALLWHGKSNDYVDLNPGEPYRSAGAIGAAGGGTGGMGKLPL